MNLIQYFKIVSLLTFSIVFFSFSSSVDPSTTIVVVDGKALLVDLDDKGQIVTTYMEVPEYFKSSKDHKTKVLEAKESYTRLTKSQMDQIRFISLADIGWDLDEFMLKNIRDLAAHYQETYANQIEITVAKNEGNAEKLEYNIKNIKNYLIALGVSEEDIIIQVKLDLGDEPTQFLKVVSNLKTLSF